MVKWGVLIIIGVIILGNLFLFGGIIIIDRLEDGSEKNEMDDNLVIPAIRERSAWMTLSILEDPHNMSFHFHHHNFQSEEEPEFFMICPWTNNTINTTASVIFHHFEDLEEISISYWITDGNLWMSETKTLSFNLSEYGDLSPIAISYDPTITMYYSDQPVMLSGHGSYDIDGDVIGYYWDFGDGTHSDTSIGMNGFVSSKIVAHTYEKTGLYTVKLYVMDNDQQVCEKPFEITIQIGR